ncbi:hypothetical protein SAMN04488543_0948 [Friedmanniella luteola]|uniref:PspA-associated domain-containing protein n=1 Tax=Friedmanniella luteola TaxID=546871 RepID=A0A1H1NWR5_9ACTN|nr:hypothetical protein [Friedmanniella luteola]SDS03235.1 hypothetical protein SAMN04488543_0948 [Friedmanniella luteola]
MIVRILGEGQWRIEDAVVADLNRLDDQVEGAVRTGDAAELERALHALLGEVRTQGQVVPDDELSDSDLILPAADSTLEDVRALLDTSDEGLIPG